MAQMAEVDLIAADLLNNKRKYGDCCTTLDGKAHAVPCSATKSCGGSLSSSPITVVQQSTLKGTSSGDLCYCNTSKALRTHRSLTASASVLDIVASVEAESHAAIVNACHDDATDDNVRLSSSAAAGALILPGGGVTWPDLPDDVLRRILDKLPAHSHRVARTVCRGWRAATSRTLRFARPDALPAALEPLALRFPNLCALDLSCCDAALELRGPSSLAFRSTLSDAALTAVVGLQHLTELSLRGCTRLTGPGLVCLASLPSLQHVDLTGCSGITDAGLAAGLRGLARVPSITLLDCWGLSDAGVATLAMLPGLQRIALPPRTTDEGLAALAAAPALQRVAIRGCARVGPDGIASLLLAPMLRRVVVSRCPAVTATALGGVAPNLSVVSCVPSATGLQTAVGASGSGGELIAARPTASAIAAPDLQLLMANFHH